MSITSFSFLVLITVGTLVYYIIPKKIQWIELLALSLVFYSFSVAPYTFIYIALATAIAYISTMLIKKGKKAGLIFCTAMISLLLIWFVIKGYGLWYPVCIRVIPLISTSLMNKIDSFQIVAAMGMGYYTLQILGYIIECYWGNIQPQQNPFKLLLFVAYFPQLTTGPISRYADLKTMYDGRAFNYDNICMGAQRILWGFFKKLVIAERVGIIVSSINADPGTYHAFYSWIALLLYPLQMYTDFSGCMDIVIGVSELFGIRLAENFNNPFFARSSQEFWQRWHITLGTWAKDYVLYPLLKSKPMISFGKFTRNKLGRKKGAFVKNLIGMFVLWMVMGIWHGGYKYIVGVSLWYWIILMLGNLTASTFEKITNIFEVKTTSFGWHLFQSIRTYIIYAVGAAFFVCGTSGGIYLIGDCIKVFYEEKYANPWIFFDGSILELGVGYRDINIILIGVLILFIVGILREKYGYARLWIKNQSFVFRWAIWLFLLMMVVIYGNYGPDFNAADFIYMGF
ncbi:MAG: MBOAT family protein [Lachnospiraceae bacterium]|nr:MBOAT family protein [Lachnospiraceae bacterium]